MIKILDLFAGTQSVRKAVETMGVEFEYIGVDIKSPEKENLILDLSQENIVEALKDKLPKGWKPDFIWASPICNFFSSLNSGLGGNYYFIVENEEIVIRYKDFGKGVTRNYSNLEKWTEAAHKKNIEPKAKLALDLHNNTKKIIKYFNVPFAIENPRTALSRFLYKDLITNHTNYCMYGFEEFSQKPTNIYSNRVLNLQVCNHKTKHVKKIQGLKSQGGITNYAIRSKVPPKLVIEILSQSIEVK